MTQATRQMALGAFLFTPGNHARGWRHPAADTGTDTDISRLAALAQLAERGKFDAIFLQDTCSVPGSASADFGADPAPHYGRIAHLEPLTLIAALAAHTTHIGLVATATTTYNQPYHVARLFASIDHISGGRAGWNLVTSQIEDEAGNFGAGAHLEHAARYARAEEFYDVVAALWDSWEDDAFAKDKASGIYFDPAKVHPPRHRGRHFSVRGPLNVPRPPQGHPLVSQAGSSAAGQALAARSADLVFTAQRTLDGARAFYREIKSQAAAHGRGGSDILVLPGVLPLIGRSEAEAREKYDELQALLPPDFGLGTLQRHAGGLDLSRYPLDGPLPELPESNSARGRQQLLRELAGGEELTIRQLAQHFAFGGGHRVILGTPGQIAEQLAAWFEGGAADGYNVMFPHFPEPLADFVDLVVPELQRMGLFKRDYRGRTLRENLGLRRPPNRHAEPNQEVAS